LGYFTFLVRLFVGALPYWQQVAAYYPDVTAQCNLDSQEAKVAKANADELAIARTGIMRRLNTLAAVQEISLQSQTARY